MPSRYPKTGPVKLRTNLADSPLAAALKCGQVSSPIVEFDFCGPKVAHDGFKAMVRDRAFDAGELAIVTYLQAKTFGKPLTLLPACVVGRFQHAALSYMHRGKDRHPREIEGQKVVLRSYTQTTPTWARGVLQHEYGVDLSKITWLTSDDPHLAEYKEPANVVRVDKKEKALDQRMIDGEVDFGIVGVDAPKHPAARRLIPDPQAAGAQWYEKYGCTHINHMFVLDSDLAAERPDVVEEVWRLLVATKKAAGLEGKAIDPLPFGVEAVAKSLQIVSQYAHEQHIIPRPFSLEELFDERMRKLKA
jgi:4,5-dihydroxyphthalate decarboxylase